MKQLVYSSRRTFFHWGADGGFSHCAARFGAAFGDEGFAGGAFDGSWDFGIALAFGALADEDDAEPVPSGFCEGCAGGLVNLEAAVCPTALNTSLTTSSPRVGAIFIFISVFPLCASASAS